MLWIVLKAQKLQGIHEGLTTSKLIVLSQHPGTRDASSLDVGTLEKHADDKLSDSSEIQM